MSETHSTRDVFIQNEGTTSFPMIDVIALFLGGKEAILVHAGEEYRLRITAKNKLILTK